VSTFTPPRPSSFFHVMVHSIDYVDDGVNERACVGATGRARQSVDNAMAGLRVSPALCCLPAQSHMRTRPKRELLTWAGSPRPTLHITTLAWLLRYRVARASGRARPWGVS